MVCSDEEYLPPAGAHSVLCTNRMMHHCNGGIFALGAMNAYREESLYGRAGSSGVTIRSFRPLNTLAPNQWMAGTTWLKARFAKALMGGP